MPGLSRRVQNHTAYDDVVSEECDLAEDGDYEVVAISEHGKEAFHVIWVFCLRSSFYGFSQRNSK